MPFRRFFLNTRILGPRLSPSTTATTLAPETNGVPATMSPPSVATKSTLVTDTSSPALAAKWSTSTVVPGVTFSCRPPLWIIAYTTRLLRSSYPDPDLWAGTKYSVYHGVLGGEGAEGMGKEVAVGRSQEAAPPFPQPPSPPFPLLHEDPRALDLLAAQGAQEAGHEPIHELEVRGQRRRGLLRAVEHFFLVTFRVDRGARAAIDEDELRLEDEAFALHISADWHHAAAAHLVDHF